MPQLLQANGIKVSHNAEARQLIIMCHAGWKPLTREASRLRRQSGDHAVVQVPAGSQLFFYVNEGVSEAGFTVFGEIVANPEQALVGLTKRPGISPQQAMKLNRPLTTQDLGSNFEVKERFAGDPTVGPHDYALYYHAEVDEKTFPRHLNGEYSADIDLATIAKGTSHKRHLSDVFDLVKNHPYKVFHFAACRVAR